MRVVASLLLFVCYLPAGQAGELLDAHVNYEDDHYLVHMDMRVKGKRDAIYAVITDFDNITAVNDTIVYSKLLESKGKQHRVHFESEGCIWIFCRRVKQVVTVTEMANGYILSEVHPDESDVKYGRTLWHIIDEGKTTRIKYDADFVPDFWVPPLIGPMMIKQRMLIEGQKTINGIESLANQKQ
jgi:hypothetical protein